MTHHDEANRTVDWHELPSDVFAHAAAARRTSHANAAARRTRVWYYARWILINLVLIAVTAWLYVRVLIPHFITKELSVQAAVLVHADYENSAPGTGTRAAHQPSQSSRAPRQPPHEARRQQPSQATYKPARADAATLRKLDAQCLDGHVFRKTVTNDVTEITEVAGLEC